MRAGWLLGLLLVLLLGAAGWEVARRAQAWFGVQDARIDALEGELRAHDARSDRLQTRLSDLVVGVQRNAAEIVRFGERIDAQDAAVGELREEFGGGRVRVQLAMVEQLLVLANDRLLVVRDVPAAVVALESADARLAVLRDPRVFAVREAIAQERAALLVVPLPDETGTALALSSLIDRAPRLALASQVPEHFAAQGQDTRSPPAADSAWHRVRLSIRHALASVFTIRREAGPPPRLLDDEQRALIRQILALKLEGARLALLRRDATSFRELCAAATGWLDDYFHAGDPGVAAARAELQRLQRVDLQPPLPEIGRSLSLLRGQLEQMQQ